MVAITVDAILGEPCPRAGITVMGLAAGDHTVSLWRAADGERVAVRGARSITITDSAYWVDYEVPLGRLVTYELEVISGADAGVQGITAQVVVESSCGYIQDPLNPSSAVPVHGGSAPNGEAYFRSEAFSNLAYTADVSSFSVMGDPRPVSISGTRMAASGVSLAMATQAEEENTRLRDLVGQAVNLVVRPLPGWGQHIPASATYAAASVYEQPFDVSWGGSLTRWEVVGDVVRGSSARVVVALWRYQDVAEIFASYDQKQATAGGGSYLDDLKNPANV